MPERQRGEVPESVCAARVEFGEREYHCALVAGHEGDHRNVERSLWWHETTDEDQREFSPRLAEQGADDGSEPDER